MQIREYLHRQIDGLDIEQLLLAQNLLAILAKRKIKAITSASPRPPYLGVREILSTLSGSLADDIMHARDDRI